MSDNAPAWFFWGLIVALPFIGWGCMSFAAWWSDPDNRWSDWFYAVPKRDMRGIDRKWEET